MSKPHCSLLPVMSRGMSPKGTLIHLKSCFSLHSAENRHVKLSTLPLAKLVVSVPMLSSVLKPSWYPTSMPTLVTSPVTVKQRARLFVH